MTLLQIDLSDVAGESHPEDTVVVWSPVHREGSAGRTVTPTQHTIRLTEGKGEREVEPGPLMVQTHVRAIADTRPKEVVVPDQDTVTLWELLDQGFTYTPPIISEVSEARVEVREAVARVGTAEQVGEWADAAKTSETNASTAASDALTIKNSIPQTVATEIDTQVPPKVAEVIAGSTVVTDAAAAAAGPAVDEAIGGRLDAKADAVDVEAADHQLSNRLSSVEPTPVEDIHRTAWAHTTESGHRLPLGYDPEGRLDDRARRVWREDVAQVTEHPDDGENAHVVTTGDGKLLAALRKDGSVVIPGLAESGGQTSGAYVRSDGTVAHAGADTTHAVGWGSSSLEGMGLELSDRFPAVGVAYTNHAKGGERISHIAARMGAIPAIINPVTIPPSGAVNVTSENLEAHALMLTFTGHLSGVHGTLSSTADTLTFTRTASGNQKNIAAPTEFIPDVGPSTRAQTTIISAGKNDYWYLNAEIYVPEMTRQMVDYLTPMFPRVLVMGHFINQNIEEGSDNWNRIADMNHSLENSFGPLFVDHRAILANPDIWNRAGITPTDADLTAQGIGKLPPSLARDNSHQNDAADKVVADIIIERMKTLGWY